MLCGIPPFYSENLEKMYDLIRTSELLFPKKIKITTEAKDLISRLLQRNPYNRLGSKYGIKEIKEHPFFSDVNFDSILERQVMVFI